MSEPNETPWGWVVSGALTLLVPVAGGVQWLLNRRDRNKEKDRADEIEDEKRERANSADDQKRIYDGLQQNAAKQSERIRELELQLRVLQNEHTECEKRCATLQARQEVFEEIARRNGWDVPVSGSRMHTSLADQDKGGAK